MKFRITMDYAIRIILLMAQRGARVSTSREVAEELGITYGYFNKIASRIRRVGFIESVQRTGGGYCLAKEAGDITLYDIIEAMEGSIFINRCLQADEMCGRKANLICPVHEIFKNVQSQIINTLSNVRISDLCAYKLL